MLIREATPADIPAIVSLLKISLGESLLPKSTEYWTWKHVQNPFGKSPVLLAFEGELLIGVRAFMCWNWRHGEQIVKSVRAVDTATHPDFQGKGIFKKLTLQLLEHCKRSDWKFVFNTPNKNSKPGYLKMGWEDAGRIPIHLKPLKPVSIFWKILTKHAPHESNTVEESVKTLLATPGLSSVLENYMTGHSRTLVTDSSVNYFVWRYQQVPVVKYHAASLQTGGFFFYRIKDSRSGREFRITDMIVSTALQKDVMTLIKAKAREHQADYITICGVNNDQLLSALKFSGLKVGPSVTIRDIGYHNFAALQKFEKWNPSIGDMELF